jgi:uncharacterized protein (DUF1501 family)
MSNTRISLLTRREFIQRSLGIVAVAGTIPTFLSRTALGMTASAAAGVNPLDKRVLVIIQLSGGNDGLNTVIPFTQDKYYKARPTLGIAKNKTLKINDSLGFHPAMTAFKGLYDSGELAIVQGVGYPNPDRSHFRSMEIWQSGIVEGFESTGWVGRTFDHTCGNAHLHKEGNKAAATTKPSPTLAVSIGETLNPALIGKSSIGVALNDPERYWEMTRVASDESLRSENGTGKANSTIDFLRRTAMNAELSAEQIRRSVRKVQSKANYPANQFAQGLKLIAAMIAGGMDTQVYYTSLGGFDTHANQVGGHERLLRTLSDGIGAFQKDLQALGQADRVLGFTFSEFGRRVAENGSRGTDHGQASQMFAFGKNVKAGILGEHPSLEKLNRGDLNFNIDFRQVYATVMDEWLKADHQMVLHEKFSPLPILG